MWTRIAQDLAWGLWPVQTVWVNQGCHQKLVFLPIWGSLSILSCSSLPLITFNATFSRPLWGLWEPLFSLLISFFLNIFDLKDYFTLKGLYLFLFTYFRLYFDNIYIRLYNERYKQACSCQWVTFILSVTTSMVLSTLMNLTTYKVTVNWDVFLIFNRLQEVSNFYKIKFQLWIL